MEIPNQKTQELIAHYLQKIRADPQHILSSQERLELYKVLVLKFFMERHTLKRGMILMPMNMNNTFIRTTCKKELVIKSLIGWLF
jgi:hypothetical protein